VRLFAFNIHIRAGTKKGTNYASANRVPFLLEYKALILRGDCYARWDFKPQARRAQIVAETLECAVNQLFELQARGELAAMVAKIDSCVSVLSSPQA
jgi:hypothetical protein